MPFLLDFKHKPSKHCIQSLKSNLYNFFSNSTPGNSIPNFQPHPPPRPARGPPHPPTPPPRPSLRAGRRCAAQRRTPPPSRDGVAPPGGRRTRADRAPLAGRHRAARRERRGGGRGSMEGRRPRGGRRREEIRHGEDSWCGEGARREGEEAMARRRLPATACCSPARAVMPSSSGGGGPRGPSPPRRASASPCPPPRASVSPWSSCASVSPWSLDLDAQARGRREPTWAGGRGPVPRGVAGACLARAPPPGWLGMWRAAGDGRGGGAGESIEQRRKEPAEKMRRGQRWGKEKKYFIHV